MLSYAHAAHGSFKPFLWAAGGSRVLASRELAWRKAGRWNSGGAGQALHHPCFTRLKAQPFFVVFWHLTQSEKLQVPVLCSPLNCFEGGDVPHAPSQSSEGFKTVCRS